MKKSDQKLPNVDRPSDEIDPDNPFKRKEIILPVSTRSCKKCGEKFDLHGDYDPENITHDLCDNCILDLPRKQKYPEKTIQIEQDELDAQPVSNDEDVIEI